ncbi:MAG: hypothetical protein Tsb009_32250 [Planctomycetaceae bacterium]
MNDQGRSQLATIFGLFLAMTLPLEIAHGQDRSFEPTENSIPKPVPHTLQKISPILDDANLHAIRFVGTKVGYAVGDHGVIWRSTDGGHNWTLLNSPVTCPLRSICFLTDRIGWIAGGGTVPHSRIQYGVLLFTQDGGQSWRILAADRRGLKNPLATIREQQRLLSSARTPRNLGRNQRKMSAITWTRLPSLQYVKFFNYTQGIAVGESSKQFPTGVMSTTDGGQSWQPVAGKRHSGWRTADFLNPQVGVTAGLQGRVSLVGSGRMLKPAIESTGLRTYRDVALSREDSGWMVGDGGLILHTENGGVSWKPTVSRLLNSVRDFSDFHAVATYGKHVWVAGSPGSIIWHTQNGGRTWTRQFTGQTTPLTSLWFSTPKQGWAAGVLGTMLKTVDGGKTWRAIRGNKRRVALMTVHGTVQQVSFPLIVKQSADLGYRSLVMLPARRDIGPDGHVAAGIDQRFPEAIAAAGGSVGIIGWQFPIAIPGLERDESKLLTDWNNRAEGRLREAFLGRLVCHLRTWRPSVIVLDQPARNDALTKVLNAAIMQAIQLAGDPTAFIKHSEIAGLSTWNVKKVFLRLPAGSTGHAHISPYEYLPRLRTTLDFASSHAASRLDNARVKLPQRESYRLMLDRRTNVIQAATSGDFFSGLSLPAGSPARRHLLPWSDRDLEIQQKLAQRQRNFQAFSKRALADDRLAGQMIAQLDSITKGMNQQRAALQILDLANEYKRHARWELAEAAMIELVMRYPQTPAAIEGMQWLFQLWTGAEPVWQRLKQIHVGRTRKQPDSSQFQNRLEQAKKLLQIPATERDINALDLDPDPVRFVNLPESHPLDRNDQRRMKGVRHWNNQALRMASLIRRIDPEKFQSPQIQFPLAALLRARGAARIADRYYRRYQLTGENNPWKITAASEIWMIAPAGQPPKTIAASQKTSTRPTLDGVLADDCWRSAKSIPLTPPPKGVPLRVGNGFVLIAHDAEYLYLAGHFPRASGLPKDLPSKQARQHDADLSKYDRVSFLLDADRDYATYYRLTIDQRGFTADSCFGNSAWNPKWFVKASGDEKSWRFEAAIPWRELAPRAPVRNTAWAMGIVRTMPGIGVQSWTHPMGDIPRPESFGFLRFE